MQNKKQFKIWNFIAKSADLLSLIAFFGLTSVPVILGIFTNLLSCSFTLKLWVLIVIPLISIFFTLLIIFLLSKFKTKQVFKKGDYVVVKNSNNKYMIHGYSYFKPTEVYCFSTDKPSEKILIDQNNLELYDSNKHNFYALINNVGHNRRNNFF